MTASRPSGVAFGGPADGTNDPGGARLTERCAAAPWVVPHAAPNLDSCGPGRPGEVMIDQIAAQDLRLRVGSRLEIGAVAGSDHIRGLGEGGFTPTDLGNGAIVVNAAMPQPLALADWRRWKACEAHRTSGAWRASALAGDVGQDHGRDGH